jgi:hypothetical protein
MQSRKMQFWALCPYCPEHSHLASFPIMVTVSFISDFKHGGGQVSAEWDKNPVQLHMTDQHPEVLGS